MWEGATEIPSANVIGSNIANILLIIGFAAVFAKGTLSVKKDLVDLDIPLLALSSLFLFGVAYDGTITLLESLFLLVAFVIYVLYSLFHHDDAIPKEVVERPRVTIRDIVLLLVGFVFLIGGAKYLIDAVLALSSTIGIPIGIITILAVAVGTSLPELIVSIKAARNGQGDLSIGNIYGSNIYNALFIVGASGLFGTQHLDTTTLTLALPMFLATTFVFITSSVSRRIHLWEGALYLLLYALFVVKIFGWV